jgi:nicotinate-nucleotide--dimethylbenzimidazole phosphoribosyltransferase
MFISFSAMAGGESQMKELEALVSSIRPIEGELIKKTQERLDRKTKPMRSLGRLEDLACRYCAARATLEPTLPKKALVVMAADHGVASEGVSAYPQEVTRQMLLNFAHGGAAINALARQVSAELVVVDMGVVEALPASAGVRACRIGAGTQNMTRGPAMSVPQAKQAILAGAGIARELADGGFSLMGIGEMGIANTTAASALLVAYTGVPITEATGRGTGIDDAILARKVQVIERAIAVNRPDRAKPLEVLAKLGGFEIAGLAGVILSAAAGRVPVIIDGFISGAAALAAIKIAPAARDYLVASHRSAENGHGLLLEALELQPLFDLNLRLGEGSGAALAMNFVDAAIRILAEMATFESAGVSDKTASK